MPIPAGIFAINKSIANFHISQVCLVTFQF